MFNDTFQFVAGFGLVAAPYGALYYPQEASAIFIDLINLLRDEWPRVPGLDQNKRIFLGKLTTELSWATSALAGERDDNGFEEAACDEDSFPEIALVDAPLRRNATSYPPAEALNLPPFPHDLLPPTLHEIAGLFSRRRKRLRSARDPRADNALIRLWDRKRHDIYRFFSVAASRDNDCFRMGVQLGYCVGPENEPTVADASILLPARAVSEFCHVINQLVPGSKDELEQRYREAVRQTGHFGAVWAMFLEVVSRLRGQDASSHTAPTSSGDVPQQADAEASTSRTPPKIYIRTDDPEYNSQAPWSPAMTMTDAVALIQEHHTDFNNMSLKGLRLILKNNPRLCCQLSRKRYQFDTSNPVFQCLKADPKKKEKKLRQNKN